MTGAPSLADRIRAGVPFRPSGPPRASGGRRGSGRRTFAVLTSTVALGGAGLAAGAFLLGSAGSAGAADGPAAHHVTSKAVAARPAAGHPAVNLPSIPANPSGAASAPGVGTYPEATNILTNPSLGTGSGNNGSVPSLSSAGVPEPDAPKAPTVGEPSVSTVGIDVSGVSGKPSQSITVLLLLTVLSVAPALLILCTSFTKIIVVLSMTRNAMGLQTIPPNQVLAGLALFLSLFVMGPTLQQVNKEGLQPYLHGTKTQQAAWKDGSAPLKTWMLAQTRKDDLNMLTNLAKESAGKAKPSQEPDLADGGATAGTASTASSTTAGASSTASGVGNLVNSIVGANPAAGSSGPAAASTAQTTADSTEPTGSDARVDATALQASKISMTTLVPAFILSELKSAFIIGFVIFLPFLIIDLVVASSLMSLGMAMVPPVLVSLPFKILLFLMVDGWALIIHSLVVSYR